MKKLLVSMLLAVVLVAPVFASEKGDMEIVGKLGFIINSLMVETDDLGISSSEKYDYNQDSSFSLGADFYYYVFNNIATGVGINYVFDSKVDIYDTNVGATNIYLAVKPVLLENKFVDKAYLLGQIGLGITRFDNSWTSFSQSGLYWGIGVGAEMYNVIVEFSYSVDYWEHDEKDWSDDWSYTNRRFAINVGYKFSI